MQSVAGILPLGGVMSLHLLPREGWWCLGWRGLPYRSAHETSVYEILRRQPTRRVRTRLLMATTVTAPRMGMSC